MPSTPCSNDTSKVYHILESWGQNRFLDNQLRRYTSEEESVRDSPRISEVSVLLAAQTQWHRRECQSVFPHQGMWLSLPAHRNKS